MLLLGLSACGSDEKLPEAVSLTRAELLNPETCKECHATHYEEWAGSMHAYAAEDPVFLAMNARGQKETNGKLGTFCVNCHAPMAVREGATDGTNVEAIPKHLKGITCYFCHNIQSVDDDHNNLITLANDETMRGAIRDPVRNGKHRSAYSEYTDRDALKSSDACGACHDLRLKQDMFGHDVHLERTFEEWRQTIFNVEGLNGQRCGTCHMDVSTSLGPIADMPGVPLKVRPRHLHDFPGVDLALTPFPEDAPQNDRQLARVQAFLDVSLVTEVCVSRDLDRPIIRVLLDNASPGHNFPSGASQDRRVWVSVKAYAGDREIFSTVDVPDGQSVVAAAAAQPDRPLWLMRDEVLKASGEEAHMFWDVARVVPRSESRSPTLQGTLKSDPFTSAHLTRRFPQTGALTEMPDRVVVNIHIRPMDFDVVDDLIQSQWLDPRFRDQLRTLTLLPNRGTASPQANVMLEWTRELALTDGFSDPNVNERLELDCFSHDRRNR
ncbi:MAG TPA: multiheme c-type cytochrome [Polyangiaceae bacterium]